MTDHSRAVQAIQTLLRSLITSPTDAEIEQVLRETMPKPQRLNDDELERQFEDWGRSSGVVTKLEKTEPLPISGTRIYRGDASIGWQAFRYGYHFAKHESTVAESPLRDRLTELVKFARDHHLEHICTRDVADLLKGDGEAARSVVLSDAGSASGLPKEARFVHEGNSAGTGNPVDVGSSPTFSTNSESAPPKGDVAAPPQRGKDSDAWLVERGGLCVGFCENRLTWVTFTDDNALRFARQRDAYAWMETFKWKPFNLKLEGAFVAGHTWAEAPAEPVAPPQESIEAHQPIECRSRYCAQHRDIWRHYEDAIAKAEPVAPPPPDPHCQVHYYHMGDGHCTCAGALEQSAPPPDLKTAWEAGAKAMQEAIKDAYKTRSYRVPDTVKNIKLVYPGAVHGEQASPPKPTCSACGGVMHHSMTCGKCGKSTGCS